MASRTILYCDVCGEDALVEATQSGSVSLGRRKYDLDLCDAHFEDLLGFVANVSAKRSRGGTVQARRGSNGNSQYASTSEVRSWARENGYEVSDRGRIPEEIIEAYNAS